MKKDKKSIREKFRNDVLIRDKFTCRLCGRKNIKLDVHHITNRKEMVSGGYIAANGITLCDNGEDGCHYKVEQFYFSEGRENDLFNKYHPARLYQLIKSSLSKALADAEKLKS